jgi:hypothetical protein
VATGKALGRGGTSCSIDSVSVITSSEADPYARTLRVHHMPVKLPVLEAPFSGFL